jgi:hypothetical protein
MEKIISNISQTGIVILLIQFLVFVLILAHQTAKTRRLRLKLHESLGMSYDTIEGNEGVFELATKCKKRYRVAAERIESVDTEAIVNSEIARFPVLKIGKARWTFLQIDELLHGGPGFLVTLGLIGTFAGLIQNMGNLSGLLLTGEGVTEQSSLIQGFASIFPSMGAAFSTSLTGVFLSSCIWLSGVFFGLTRTKSELEQLLCGYLEQVVQADCRCYSLVGESMERMEDYLTDYLSKFSKIVGDEIESSINRSIEKLVNNLSSQVRHTADFVEQVSSGSRLLLNAGRAFGDATEKLEQSSFARDFSESCSLFIDHTNKLKEASNFVHLSSSALSETIQDLIAVIQENKNIQSELGANFNNAITAIESSNVNLQQTSSISSQSLESAVIAIQGLQKRGMTWLSMRAKTDSKLTEVNKQLQDALIQYSLATKKISESADNTFSEHSKQLADLSRALEALTETTQQQAIFSDEVRTGLTRIASIEQQLESLDPQQ